MENAEPLAIAGPRTSRRKPVSRGFARGVVAWLLPIVTLLSGLALLAVADSAPDFGVYFASIGAVLIVGAVILSLFIDGRMLTIERRQAGLE